MVNKLLKGLFFGLFLVFIFFGASSKAQAVCTTEWSAYSDTDLYNGTNYCGVNNTAGSASGLNKTVVSMRVCTPVSGICDGTETCGGGTLVYQNQYLTTEQPYWDSVIFSPGDLWMPCVSDDQCDSAIIKCVKDINDVVTCSTAYDECLSKYEYEISQALSDFAQGFNPQTYTYAANLVNQKYLSGQVESYVYNAYSYNNEPNNIAYSNNTKDIFLRTFNPDPYFPACINASTPVRVPLPGVCFPPYTYFEAPATINGACASPPDGTALTSAPSSNLCSLGTASSVTGSGPWNWTCVGSGTGHTDAPCSASLSGGPVIIGACGTADGVMTTYAPTSNLCSLGTASSVTGSGPWSWTCLGSGGGGNDPCSAPLNATAPLWLEVTPSFNSINAGQTASYTIIVHAEGIWPMFNYITLSTTNCPGTSCTFSKNNLVASPDFDGYITNPSRPITMTVTGAPVGYYTNLKINADVNGGNGEHGDRVVSLKVGPPTCTSTGPTGVVTSQVSGTLFVNAYGVSPDVTSVTFPTWGETNGQFPNDLNWYPGTNMGGGTWRAAINMANHSIGNPEYGNIFVHVYMNTPSYSNILCGTAASFVRTPPTTCNPATVGTNQMYGCSYNGTGFNTLMGGAITGPVLSSPVPASATALPYQDWAADGPNGLQENFSVRWKGNFNFDAGTYAFRAGSDDGNRLYIDGNLFLDKWVSRAYAEDTVNINFPVAGQHTVTYEYYQGGSGAAYSLSWTKIVAPTVDLKVNTQDTSVGSPLAIPRKDSSSINLTWNVTGATSCTAMKTIGAPGVWVGSKNIASGNETLSPVNVAGTYSYSLSCTGPGGTTADTVYITVPACNVLPFVSGSVSPASVAPLGSYTKSCNYGVVNNQISMAVGSGSCSGWSYTGSRVDFTCTAGGAAGTYSNDCSLVAPMSPDYYCARTDAINDLVVTCPSTSNLAPTGSVTPTSGNIDLSFDKVTNGLQYFVRVDDGINSPVSVFDDTRFTGRCGPHFYCEDYIPAATICSGARCTITNIPVVVGRTYTYWVHSSDAVGAACPNINTTFTPSSAVGTIAVRYTIDGVAQSANQAITYSIAGPTAVASASYTVNNTSSHTSRNVGSYTFTYTSGVPAGKVFSSVTPSLTQTLNAGATITYTINFVTPNLAPISNATISKDGITYANSITVIRGQLTPIYLAASSAAGASSDPNGWSHPTYGMNGGTAKCQWNRDLNQGPVTFELPDITAPAGPANCNIFLGNRTFNDAPGTYTYNVLRLTDRAGAVSATTDTVQVTVALATVDLKMTVWDAGSRTVPYQYAPGATTVNSDGPVTAFYSAPLGLSWTLGPGLLLCDLSDSRTGSIKSGFNTSGIKNDTDIGPDSFSPVNRTVTYTLTCMDGSMQGITDTVTVSVPPAPTFSNWICKPDGVTALMVWGITPNSYQHFWVRGYDGATTVLSNDSYDGKSAAAGYELGSLEYVTSPGHTYSFTVRTKATPSNSSYSNPLTFNNIRCPATPPPTVNLKVNTEDTSAGSPLAIPRKNSSTMTLSWTVADATTCTATKSASAPGTWTGSKATTTGSSVLSPINVAGSHNYTLSCTGPGGTTTDTVYISVPACNSLTFVSGSVSPATVGPSGAYTVSCNYGVVNQQTVPIVTSGSCGSGTFTSTTANFSCTAGAGQGTYANSCSISAPAAPDYYCATTNAINNLVVLPPAPPAPVSVTANNSICEQVTIQWADGSGGGSITSYQVWRNTVSTFGGSNVSGDLANTIHSYVNTPVTAGTPYYYWVRAVGPGGHSDSPVGGVNFPVASTACMPNLLTSDKDIVAINDSGFSTGSCDGTDPLPANMQIGLGDKLKFSINLCNSGAAAATITSLVDNLTNLIIPTTGWNAKYDDGSGEVPLGTGSAAGISMSVSGTDPNKVLTFSGVPNVPMAPVTPPAIRRITFEAKVSVPLNFSATSARFQNGFTATYNAGVVSKFTPLILFFTGKGVPTVEEVP